MTTNRYFTNFPVINYNGASAVNITERVVFANSSLRNPYLFYPYDISNNERPDQLASRYYKDSYKSWLLYLANQIVDPYYGWYLSDDDFSSFLTIKYGSTQLAQTKIKYFENNWYQGGTISTNQYSALATNLLKYWQPNYDAYGNIIYYSRTSLSYKLTTNSVRSYTVANTSFINDEICNIVFNSNNVGNGQIVTINSNTNTIYLQHVFGVTTSNTTVPITANSYIYGTQSGVNTAFTTATDVCDNLAADENVYWNPVTYYQYEAAKNQYNKSIMVLDSAYTGNVVSNIQKLLS